MTIFIFTQLIDEPEEGGLPKDSKAQFTCPFCLFYVGSEIESELRIETASRKEVGDSILDVADIRYPIIAVDIIYTKQVKSFHA